MQFSTIGVQTGIAKYSAAAQGADGKIYFIPGSAKQIMILDPATDMVEYDDFGIDWEPFSHYWSSAVMANNGKIVCAPSFSNKILVINTFSNGDPATVNLITDSRLVAPNAFKFEDGYLHTNGLIYFPPRHFNHILEFNPTNNAIRLHRALQGLTRLSKFSGSVKLNDRMYCVPFNYGSFMVVDPAIIENRSIVITQNNVTTVTNYTEISTSTIPVTNVKNPSRRNRWEGGVVKDNKVYGIPYLIPEVLILERQVNQTTGKTTGHSIRTLRAPPSEEMGRTRSMYMGGALLDDKIICSPYSSDRLMVINTNNDTLSFHQLPVKYSMDKYKWSGAIATDTAVYLIPYNANDILKIIPG